MGAALEARDLYALADSLQMELKERDPDRKTDSITGTAAVKFKMPSVGLVLTFKPKVVSSRVYGDKNAVTDILLVVKVQGELHMLVHHNLVEEVTTIRLLNGLMIAEPLAGFFANHSREKGAAVLKKLSKAVVASYSRTTYGPSWKAIP